MTLPSTLQELRAATGKHGTALASRVERATIAHWLDADKPRISNPLPVAMLACQLVHEARNYEARILPSGTAPLLYGLSQDSQNEAELIAEETYFDWRDAGYPRISPRRIKQTYRQHLHILTKEQSI